MKTSRLLLSILVASAACATWPALAQQAPDNTPSMERLDRIEHDVMLLQRQVSRGGGDTSASGGTDANVPAGGSAQLEVRLSAIEDQLRDLRGKIEENDNHFRKLSESMDKFQHDIDFRLN